MKKKNEVMYICGKWTSGPQKTVRKERVWAYSSKVHTHSLSYL